MFRLLEQELVGADHRVGWPAVVAILRMMSDDLAPLLLDDFVERTFTYPGNETVHERPWVGIFHHTPRMPAWMASSAPPQIYLRSKRFRSSLPLLRGAVTLCKYTADWFRQELGVPTVHLPYALPKLGYTWKPVLGRRVWQFGWYLRNTCLLDQIQTGHTKLRPKLTGAAAEYDRRVRDHWRLHGTRSHAKDPHVHEVERLSNADYDSALQHDLVVVEYFDVGASTLLLECLAAANPVICGYHPAIAEYLGEEYPLYAEGPKRFQEILRDEDLLIDGHIYLRERRRQAGRLSDFATGLFKFLQDL